MKIQNEKASQKGFDIKIIWESDYNKNKEETLKNCLDFLLS